MDSKLYEALICDDIDAVKEMEKRIKVCDQLTPTKSTVLHLACQYGSINCAKEILRIHESLLLKINSRGETALHLAASQGHYDVVGVLIDAAKSSRLQPNNLTDTSLTVVQILMRTTSSELETALHAAVRYKRKSVVQLLVKQDPSHSHPKNKYNETPLYLASIKCEYGIIDTILQNCTSPTFGGPDGRTALHTAAMNHAGFECMKLLLEKMKDLIKIADNRGWTAYHYVAYNDICEIVEDLVRVDKSVGYLAEKEYKRTALHIAAHKGNRRVLMKLIRYYPDCWEVVDVNGKNLLHIAVERYITYPQQDVINFVLSRGFKTSNNLLNQRDNEGNTPLHLMTKLECYVPQLMDPMRIDWVVDWDVLDRENCTPLDVLHDRYMTNVHDHILPDQAFVRGTHENAVYSGASLNFWPMLKGKHIEKVRVQSEKEREYLKGKKVHVAKIKEYRSVINTHMIVAALITTVALTAGFTMPNNFHENTLTLFKMFIATDAIALLSSISSLFLYFAATWHTDAHKVQFLIVVSTMLNIYSIIAMVVAFVTGIYATLSGSPGVAISVFVISSFFLLLILYICSRKCGKLLKLLHFNAFFQKYITRTKLQI